MTNINYLGRSSILSHVNATLQGLPTIRACNASTILEQEFHDYQDMNTATDFLFQSTSIWFGVCLDVVCLLFIATVTYSFLILEMSMLDTNFTITLNIVSIFLIVFSNNITNSVGSTWC